MKKYQALSITARRKSFQFAFSGIRTFFKSEPNAWLHLVATCVAIAVAVIVGVTNMEAVAIIFAICIVWVAELFNTCIEKIMDSISTEKHPQIKFIKDLAAGAVLVASIAALIIGFLIFIPKILL